MINFENKKILFITTKNLDYLRNVQEIEMLNEKAKSVDVIGYSDKSYIKRLIKIYIKILLYSFSVYDCVFIGFAPQLILPWLKWKMKNKIIIMDFFISVYDTLVFDRKKVDKNSFLALLFRWIDTKCIGMADYIISDTNAHGDYFCREFSVSRNKIETLYLQADESIYYKREIKKPSYLIDKYVVLYFGSVLPLQGLDVILKAIDILNVYKDIYFIVIGPIKNKVQLAKNENVEYIEWLAQEQLAEYITYADLCLAGHFNNTIDKAKRTIPGKAYIYEAMNKTMILGDNIANRELFKNDKNHFFVEMGNPIELAALILNVKGEKNEENHI